MKLLLIVAIGSTGTVAGADIVAAGDLPLRGLRVVLIMGISFRGVIFPALCFNGRHWKTEARHEQSFDVRLKMNSEAYKHKWMPRISR